MPDELDPLVRSLLSDLEPGLRRRAVFAAGLRAFRGDPSELRVRAVGAEVRRLLELAPNELDAPEGLLGAACFQHLDSSSRTQLEGLLHERVPGGPWVATRGSGSMTEKQLIAVAAAAVVAVVLVVRFWPRLKVRGAPEASSDYTMVREAADRGAAWAVELLRSRHAPPSSWSLETAASERDSPTSRALLREASELDVSGPAEGERFDPTWMRDVEDPPVPGDHDKQVYERIAPAVRHGEAVLVPAEVHCRSMDIALLSGHAHPISREATRAGSPYLSTVEDVRRGWRTDHGLRDLEGLEARFSTEELDAWAEELVEVFAPLKLRPRGARVGEAFAPERMEAEGGVPGFRAVVSEVIRPGLANEGGYAIVKAVVRVRSALES